MNELALFAGAGGGLLASKMLGWNTVCACEIERYPRERVLDRQREGHLDRFPIWDDVRTFNGREWAGSVDVISGGFPCQDISSAGLGAGLAGARSGLWTEYARIIREVGPRFVFAENSPLLRARGLGTILNDLDGMGYDARWCVLGAWHLGAPHRRNRMWILAYPKRDKIGEESCRRKAGRVGREFKSVPWDEPWESALRRIRGVDARLAGRVEQTDAVRNGQVPVVAATAWNILSDGLI